MSTNTEQISNELPIACRLSEQERVKRGKELDEGGIFQGVQQVQELADGYAFRYPGDSDWMKKLVDFIAFERVCCPFFTFELVFEPNMGPIWLRLRGGEGVKEFIKGMSSDVQGG